MPSSPRSTRSTRSINPTIWRTISKKNSAPTSLSYVVAAPEQGLPLASALSKLPSQESLRTSETQSSMPSSPHEAAEGVAGPLSSIAVPNGIPLPESESSSQAHACTTSVLSGDADKPAPQDTTATEPSTSIPPDETATRSSPIFSPNSGKPASPTRMEARSSWFGSLSRAKGKAKAAHVADNITHSAEKTVLQDPPHSKPPITPAVVVEPPPISLPSLHSCLSAEASSISQAPQVIQPESSSSSSLHAESASLDPPRDGQSSTRRSWFSSTTPSSSVRRSTVETAQGSGATPAPAHPQNKASSLPASQVPPAPTETPSRSSTPVTTSASAGSASRQGLSSLNPSSSRFSLNTPLLGRPKTPLEQALLAAQSEPPNPKSEAEISATNALPCPTHDFLGPSVADSHKADFPDTQTTSGPLVSYEQKPLNSAEDISKIDSPSANPDIFPAPQASMATSSSWWDYLIGAKSSTDPQHVEPKDTTITDACDSADPQRQGMSPCSMTATTSSGSPPDTSNPETSSHAGAVDPTTPAVTNFPEATRGITESGSKASATSRPNTATSAGTAKEAAVLPAIIPSADPDPRVQQEAVVLGQPEPTAPLRTWYNPWAWYASPLSSQDALSEGGNSRSKLAAVDEHRETVTAAEENGKGNENLANDGASLLPGNGEANGDAAGDRAKVRPRPRGEFEETPDGLTSKDGEGEGVNPVEASIFTHKTGWASFFTSRSLIVKTITSGGEVKRDENGMEVMDIDDEEGEKDDQGRNITGRGRNDRRDDTVAKVGPRVIPSKNKDLGSMQATPASSPASAASIKATNGTAVKVVVPSEAVKKETTGADKQLPNQKKSVTSKVAKSESPGPSSKSRPRTPLQPNLVLPTWTDMLYTAPRNVVPPPMTTFAKTMKFVSGVLFAQDQEGAMGGTVRGKGKGKESDYLHFGKKLPRAWDVMKDNLDPDVLRGCRRVVVIGIHGWFPGAIMRTVIGEPTGTSSKFANMMVQAIEEFQVQQNVKLDKITKVPLEGEGTISGRVEKLYANLKANQEWMDDLQTADAILVATHSQGSVVATHLLDCLIQDGYIRTSRNTSPTGVAEPFSPAGLHTVPAPKPQRVCCLALCGIHLGPLRYLSSSSLLQPYIQYFESVAAKELFEFQNTDNDVSKSYVNALRRVLDHGIKMVYVASLNDQVVPLYSGLFTAASHPLILRALYIDGDAYHSSDFLSNLLVLLLRLLNSGISDSGLLAHLSEATAGSLNGVGHSTAYEEVATYSLAVKYLFLTNDGLEAHPELVLEPFNANADKNDYEIPWSLRDVIANDHAVHFFSREIAELRDAFRDWHPRTSILRDLKRKLQPIQRLPSSFGSSRL